MTDWTEGYVADIAYTHGYYQELNPVRAAFALLNAGYAVPEFSNGAELGFGQGLSINMHAASQKSAWFGNDFNPAQAAFARELAQASGAACQLVDDSFEELLQKRDLPEFDFIGLHGIWSWISDANRAVIVDFIRRKLKVGGVLYVSYNTMPGWAAFAPMRHLMSEHAEVLGAEGRGIVSRIDGAIDFAEKLLATNPLFGRANPLISERLKKVKAHNRQYLAHEYFNRDWHPMHFATMVECLQAAKVQYACSAHYLDHIDAVNLSAEQQSFIKEIPDPLFREAVYDFMVNRQFRRDYWVKGARKLSLLEQSERLSETRVLLVSKRDDVPLKTTGAMGEAALAEAVYKPILDLMADHKTRTLGQIKAALKQHNISLPHVLQAAMVLAGMGHFAVAQDDSLQTKARKSSEKFNEHVMQKARGGNEINYLTSPVTGGGVQVPRINQLFLLAMRNGHNRDEDLATFVWKTLQLQNQRMLKEGKPLATAEENLKELQAQAQTFLQDSLPILKALSIA